MNITMYPCGCSFSIPAELSTTRPAGFSVCEFHANHDKIQAARVGDLRSIIEETMDEWQAWYYATRPSPLSGEWVLTLMGRGDK